MDALALFLEHSVVLVIAKVQPIEIEGMSSFKSGTDGRPLNTQMQGRGFVRAPLKLSVQDCVSFLA